MLEYDNETGEYYRITERRNADLEFPEQYYQRGKQEGWYCGSCQGTCLVTSKQICCHNMLQFGFCPCPETGEE